MALETCIAFLIADDLDADECGPLKITNVRSEAGDNEGKKDTFSEIMPSLADLDFYQCLQLSHSQVEELINLMSSFKWDPNRPKGWTTTHAVLSSLWTLSTLESYECIAARFHITESLICEQMNEFCELITENFADRIHWPKLSEAAVLAAGFSAAVGLPGTVCVVGSCSVQIDRPTDVPVPDLYRHSEEGYFVNLMAFCNYQGCFTYVTAEHPGNWHNSRVLLETKVGRALQEDPVNLLHGKHILGDTTFPLSEHLLTPFPDCGNLGEKKLRYNMKVQKALRVVHGSLYNLKSKFQRLKSLSMNSIHQISMAVRTCCILYNMYLANSSIVECMEEHAIHQQPFHELPNGHSGSLGGISKRQDIAASLGRKPRSTLANGYYRVWHES